MDVIDGAVDPNDYTNFYAHSKKRNKSPQSRHGYIPITLVSVDNYLNIDFDLAIQINREDDIEDYGFFIKVLDESDIKLSVMNDENTDVTFDFIKDGRLYTLADRIMVARSKYSYSQYNKDRNKLQKYDNKIILSYIEDDDRNIISNIFNKFKDSLDDSVFDDLQIVLFKARECSSFSEIEALRYACYNTNITLQEKYVRGGVMFICLSYGIPHPNEVLNRYAKVYKETFGRNFKQINFCKRSLYEEDGIVVDIGCDGMTNEYDTDKDIIVTLNKDLLK